MTLFNEQHQQPCFTAATCLTNQPPARQDGAGAVTCPASKASVFLAGISQVPASVTDGRAAVNQGDSKPRFFFFFTYLFIYLSLPSKPPSKLESVDCSVVCPHAALICLWGSCSELSKALGVMRLDSFLSCLIIFCKLLFS